jgi:hypothetical protein
MRKCPLKIHGKHVVSGLGCWLIQEKSVSIAFFLLLQQSFSLTPDLNYQSGPQMRAEVGSAAQLVRSVCPDSRVSCDILVVSLHGFSCSLHTVFMREYKICDYVYICRFLMSSFFSILQYSVQTVALLPFFFSLRQRRRECDHHDRYLRYHHCSLQASGLYASAYRKHARGH